MALVEGISASPSKIHAVLTFSALEDNSSISMEKSTENAPILSLEYSLNGSRWQPFEVGGTVVHLSNRGDFVSIRAGRGGNAQTAKSEYDYNRFRMSGLISASGSIMWLIDGSGNMTTVGQHHCFCRLFSDCSSLVTPPELPSTTLSSYCYSYMFDGCSSLQSSPTLESTAVQKGCYMGMFHNCVSLEIAPSLPSTQLAPKCYANMFGGCNSLRKAPKLMALKLEDGCYDSMFRGCRNMSEIEVGFRYWADGICTSNWLKGTSDGGVLKCPMILGTMFAVRRGIDFCPEGWTVDNGPMIGFKAEEDDSSIMMKAVGTSIGKGKDRVRLEAPSVSLEYTTNGYSWKPFAVGKTVIELKNAGDVAFMRAVSKNERMAISSSRYNHFVMKGKISAIGDIMGLIDSSEHVKEIPSTHCFLYLFRNCASLLSAPELTAKSLKSYCYYGMFYGCSSLSYIKVGFDKWDVDDGDDIIGATSYWLYGVKSNGTFECTKALGDNFDVPRNYNNCPVGWNVVTPSTKYGWWLSFAANEPNSTISMESVGNAPDISLRYSFDGHTWKGLVVNKTTIILENVGDRIYIKAGRNGNTRMGSSDNDYNRFSMSGSISANGNILSILQGETDEDVALVPYAFNGLFENCSSLTSTPNLPSMAVSEFCYRRMFAGCSRLTKSDAILSSIKMERGCYQEMFSGCTSLKDMPKLPSMLLSELCYSGMFEGCTSLTNAKPLNATTLHCGCYKEMFKGCTSLKTSPYLPSAKLASNCYAGMFHGCTAMNEISVGFESWTEVNGTNGWVVDVSRRGIFKCPSGLGAVDDFPRGYSGCPLRWSVVNS